MISKFRRRLLIVNIVEQNNSATFKNIQKNTIEHSGTIDDPIPYEPSMEIFSNKYYIQSDTLYKCIRDIKTQVSQNLNDLVVLYVELV